MCLFFKKNGTPEKDWQSIALAKLHLNFHDFWKQEEGYKTSILVPCVNLIKLVF